MGERAQCCLPLLHWTLYDFRILHTQTHRLQTRSLEGTVHAKVFASISHFTINEMKVVWFPASVSFSHRHFLPLIQLVLWEWQRKGIIYRKNYMNNFCVQCALPHSVYVCSFPCARLFVIFFSFLFFFTARCYFPLYN